MRVSEITPKIKILYTDEHVVAVDKPAGFHVHPSRLSPGETSVLDILESQMLCKLHPVHRLDKPVSGVLLMARNSQIAGNLGTTIQGRNNFRKRYLCIVRGWMHNSGIIDRSLRQMRGKTEYRAITRWRMLAHAQLPWEDSVFPESRYSLVECIPETGRFHQIRRHLSFAGHPIMGDVSHGDGRRNRIWWQKTGFNGLMLRSKNLDFLHPVFQRKILVSAEAGRDFQRVCSIMNWDRKLL